MRREVVDRYVAGQVANHPVVDPLFEARLKALQIWRPEIDLAGARRNTYGQYWYALHLVTDHLHRELGCGPEIAPGDAALSYMNSVAYHLGMRSVLETGYYVGTIGEYDRGAIGRWRSCQSSPRPGQARRWRCTGVGGS